MRVLRPLGLVLIAAWSLLILVWLALHWIILPHIDQWREPIERRASQMLGQTVRIGEVIVTSSGWVPAVELRNVDLLDAQAAPALRLPRVVAALSVHSLLTLQPRFEQLFIDGAHLEMRRDQAGHLFVAGLDVSGADGSDRTLANWFFKQHEFVIRGGTLRWTDEMHTAAPLSLTDVQLVVRNSLRRHDWRIDATPPAEWGERFTLMAQFTQPLLAPSGDWRRWKGTLYELAAGRCRHAAPARDAALRSRSRPGRAARVDQRRRRATRCARAGCGAARRGAAAASGA